LKRKKIKKIIVIIFLVIIVAIGGILGFIKFYPSIGKLPNQSMQRSYQQKTKLYYDGEFHNSENIQWDNVEEGKKSEDVSPKKDVPIKKRKNIRDTVINDMKITWFGHSTSLLQIHSMNILIDPIFSNCASPVSFMGSKRFSEIAMKTEDLPHIDVVFISHGDYDHLDYQTIKKIDHKVDTYIVPLGIDSYLKGWGVSDDKIIALSWWEETYINDVQFTLTEAQHYCVRNPLGFNETWWGGLYVRDEYHSFYYTGDSGYNTFFKKLNEKYGDIELFLSDTGQYDPSWKWCHMNPQEATQAAIDVKAKYHIPVHWGAFVLSNHAWNEPAKLLSQYEADSNVKTIIPMIGETVSLSKMETYNNKTWWEEGSK